MIQLKEIKNFSDRIDHLKNLKENQIYIVSDVKSKITFQNFLLNKKSIISSACIQKAQSFYEQLFLSIFSDYTMISTAHLEFFFQTWMTQHSSFLSNKKSILNELQFFLPIFTHVDGLSIFEQWLNDSQIHQKQEWIKNYHITKLFWKELQDRKWMESSCAIYTLLNQNIERESLPSSMIVDLGFSLTHTEKDLYSSISHLIPVTLLMPTPLQSPIFTNSHQVYQSISSYPVQSNKHSLKKKRNSKKIQTYVFNDQVEEVRFLTYQIRNEIQKGTHPSHITVVAPKIELYWPCLKAYLKKEGIPFQKEPTISVLSLSQIQQWISSIRLHFGHISFSNVEDSCLYDKDYTQFKSQYYYCDRKKDIQKLSINFCEKKQICINEFLEEILPLWQVIIKRSPQLELNNELNSMLSKISLPFFNHPQYKANSNTWIQLLENTLRSSYIHKKENPLKEGIVCISLNAITGIYAKKVYFTSLDHVSCQKSYSTVFYGHHIKNMIKDLGFDHSHLDPDQYEYELTYFLNSFEGSISLSYHKENFESSISYPSRTWLIENQDQGQNHYPVPSSFYTVWDSVKTLSSVEEIIQQSRTKHCTVDIQQSLDSNSINNRQLEMDTHFDLSVSRLNSYIHCPFVFLAKYIFSLKELHIKDTDCSHLEKGSLMHELFEIIIKENLQTDKEIKSIALEYIKKLNILDEELLDFYSSQIIQKLNQFIQHEKQKKMDIPNFQTVGTEIEFSSYWNLQTQQMEKKGDFLIKGKIDRIDRIHNHLLIIDYKKSLYQIKTISRWSDAKKLETQMPIYIQASALGEIPQITAEDTVVAALYLGYQDFTYKGFSIKESEWSQLLPKRSQSKIESNKKNTILKEINKKIQNYIQNIQQAKFEPIPIDKSNCNQCQWKQICRAKHLN